MERLLHWSRTEEKAPAGAELGRFILSLGVKLGTALGMLESEGTQRDAE